ncbi:MAG TPA: TMEM175 family protein [Mucilaginibacter sp.]
MTTADKKMKPMQMDSMYMGSTPERVYAFSDGVFAIIITIMVLELKSPRAASFSALGELWPTWLSYGVSYAFIAVVWMNHHYLLKYAKAATLRLMWANFAHLFSVSLIPFFTDWLAETRLMPVPVMMYAFVFLLANITYLWLVWELLCDETDRAVPVRVRRLLHVRSFITISLFAGAMVVAFWFPLIAFAMICSCLILYLRPELRTKNLMLK